METYGIKSIVGEIAKGIRTLIEQGVIQKDKKVILYGLDQYSFAMRTILSNLGYGNIEGYVSADEALVLQYRLDIQNFACRFLNGRRDMINVWTIRKRLYPFDSEAVILIASRQYEQEKELLEVMGYKESVHFYRVYDFEDKEWSRFFEGKKKLSLEEIKQTEKELLNYVDKLCRKHGLRYWVCGGTLLGTIRHQGFIPWDDDIDIFLPWQDYQRSIGIFEETERFGIIGFATEKNNFFDLFAKVVDKRTVLDEDKGTIRKKNPLWIDVFPLIGLPDDAGERHLFFAGYKELSRRIWQEFYASNGDADTFSKWFSRQKEYVSKYDFDRAAYVGVLGTVYGERDSTGRRVYDETLRMPFEDIEVNVPGGYQEYLDNLYGKDWRQLPEESKRKTHHNISVYWDR